MRFSDFGIVAVLVALLGLPVSSAIADSWEMPYSKAYPSENGEFELFVVPRGITGWSEYFDDASDGVSPAGQDPEGAPYCMGELRRKVAGGSFETVWRRELLNELAPASVLVDDEGVYAVTFDNWHAVGYGDHVVVIFGPQGALIRQFGLVE